MGRDNDIANRLRAEGLRVVECDGWTERGSSDFSPKSSVNHHTAGPKDGNIPSLNTLIYGRSDLPGPLCNVAQARDNSIYVISSGRANHAGSGGWRGVSGNSAAYGLEIEHTGTSSEAWTEDRVDTAARVHAALIRGRFGADMVCQHKEWAPSRKIDAYQSDGDTFRNRVKDYLTGGPPPTSTASEDSMLVFVMNPHRSGEIWATDFMAKRPVRHPDTVTVAQAVAFWRGINVGPMDIDPDAFDEIPED